MLVGTMINVIIRLINVDILVSVTFVEFRLIEGLEINRILYIINIKKEINIHPDSYDTYAQY